ncbi:MAG: hypothetical protein IKV16_02810 [Clostridia bacterium]|nr:hypothetical protein [Clostridia bacterium]
MQKKLCVLITALIFSILAFALISCDEGEQSPTVCTSHADADLDKKCDVCGEILSENEPEQDDPCTECADADGDGFCDRCGEEVTVTPPECDHNDEGYDGRCDLCKEDMKDAISLVNLRKTNFNIVIAPGFDGDSMLRIKKLSSDLEKLGVTMNFYTEKDAPECEYEIIFGEMTSRGEEYFIDSHHYGLKGYAIKVIGTKIVVVAGSSESLITAINVLKSEFFGITPNTVVLINRVVYPSQSISVVQSDYKVDTITLLGKDINGYRIAVDKKNGAAKSAAEKLQKLLYEKTGYWLTIADKSEVSANAIFIDTVEKCGDDGFAFTVGEDYMRFESEYTTSIVREPCDFFTRAIDAAVGSTLELGAESAFTKNVHCVYYSDFGAVGDGVSNDTEAIRAAHEYANSGGHKKVAAESGKTYYLDKSAYNIYVRCDVDWSGAKFIIDDSVILASDTAMSYDVFLIESEHSVNSFSPSKTEAIKLLNEAGGIDKSTVTKIDLGLGYPAILKVYNSSHKNYIRTGANVDSGQSQFEVILVDAEGNIDPTTPFMFDYEKITSIYAYRTDESPLSIVGGEFTTVANKSSINLSYKRGIKITHSNVTVTDLKHYIVGEGAVGSPYASFINLENSNNILFDGCVFTGRKTYYNGTVGSGSYEFSSKYSTNVTWLNCTQSNLFTDDGKPMENDVWGVMASSYSKNLKFDGCSLNRFDAHHGVLNAEILNSKVKNIRIVGAGTFTVSDTVIYGNTLISLREDYGAFWLGDVILKNVTMKSSSAVTLFGLTWYNHDFGYQTALPSNIVIDGLKIDGENKKVNIFSTGFVNSSYKILMDEFEKTNASTGTVTVTPNKNKMTPPERITVKNNVYGLEFMPLDGVEFFKNTEIIFE